MMLPFIIYPANHHVQNPLVGFLALQGAFEEHQQCFVRVGCRTIRASGAFDPKFVVRCQHDYGYRVVRGTHRCRKESIDRQCMLVDFKYFDVSSSNELFNVINFTTAHIVGSHSRCCGRSRPHRIAGWRANLPPWLVSLGWLPEEPARTCGNACKNSRNASQFGSHARA